MAGRTLHFIHIGKCGGATVENCIRISPRLSQLGFDQFRFIHVRRPVFDPDVHYLIAIRNPISRALSAFNWRYRLVVEDEIQRHRFVSEWDILTRYGTLDSLARRLYRNGVLDQVVARDFRSIHHLDMSIAFYLDSLLRKVDPQRILGVVVQESMAADIARHLDVENPFHMHDNAGGQPVERKVLGDEAIANLAQFLHDDFRCIAELHRMGALSAAQFERLSRLPE